MPDDLSQLSLLEIFREEAEHQTEALTAGLLALEKQIAPEQAAQRAELLESLMRAAHSLKGAAQIVNLPAIVRLAHAMEDCFVAVQKGNASLADPAINDLLAAVDLLLEIAQCPEARLDEWDRERAAEVERCCATITQIARKDNEPPPVATPRSASMPGPSPSDLRVTRPAAREVKLNADNLNRLLGLAGETLVESRWLRTFSESLQRLKRMEAELESGLAEVREELGDRRAAGGEATRLAAAIEQTLQLRSYLTERLEALEAFERRSVQLSHRLYLEALRTRMRPFREGVRRFPRMVRDLAHSLGKKVRLEIVGEATQVDRDILEQLETPLAHLLRNAVDHGCESPEIRLAKGKPAEAVIQLEAHHSAGMLLITISDDGAGVDTQRLRQTVTNRRLTTAALAENLSESELLEFLFLPGFTLKDAVTEISGRGVGLDVVQNAVKSVRGSVRIMTQAGRGTRFQLQLPLTLSVVRALLVEVAAEAYAIPLAQITRTLKLDRQQIETLEGRHHFAFGNQRIGLLTAHQVLDCEARLRATAKLSVVVLGDRNSRYGLVVDGFLGERELVVQALDPRLGKVPDISAAALMEDGSPVLIVDVDDLVRSIERLISSGAPIGFDHRERGSPEQTAKRILAVDDSMTVRELERKILSNHGYRVDVSVDGMDGWNAVRTGAYDLVITDVDMPRMDGIELAALIKRDPQLKSIPVMVVSYKDREEDRLRGLEAGADYYLTKGSFHNDSLLQAVLDLIGEP